MAIQTYLVGKNKDEQLTLSWGLFWSNFTVQLDGQLIGTSPDKETLVAGQTFQLKDDSQLFVRLIGAQVEVYYNNQALFANPSNNLNKFEYLDNLEGQLKFVVGVMATVGVLGILLGLFEQTPSLALSDMIIMAIGVVFCVLARYVYKRSMLALVIGLIMYGADTLATIRVWLSGNAPSIYIIALVLHILVLLVMGVGLETLNELRKLQKPNSI